MTSLDIEKQVSSDQEEVIAEQPNPKLKIDAPTYIPAPGQPDGSISRSFSKRQGRVYSHHIFGGDLMDDHVENRLELFQSQAGQDRVIVHWEGEGDMENPMNWSTNFRWYLTFLSGMLVLNSTFTSSAPSGIVTDMMAEFGFGTEVAILTISLFVAGYCLGPLLFGPLSERLGRRPIFLVALTAYTAFNLGCALSPNTAAILIFRFLSGCFASSPLTNSGGVIADIWDSKRRGIALSIFSISPFAGPALGPIISGAIHVTGTDWRWVYWVCTIFSGACLVLTALTLPETFAAKLLLQKAKRIRRETSDDRYVAPLELSPLHFKGLLHATLLKPFIMLAQEPILALLTLYMSIIYGTVYLLFEAFPVVFSGLHGFNNLEEGLAFIPFFLGGVASVLYYILIVNPKYVRKVDASKTGQVPPEERLPIVMIGGISLTVSFFWFAWTSYPGISYWSPLMAGFLIGFGVLFLFLGIFNYLIDAYTKTAATALAANTVCRSLAGAAFPLFAGQMYQALGPRWASTLVACLALVNVPLPFLFYRYGARIRALSKHAQT